MSDVLPSKKKFAYSLWLQWVLATVGGFGLSLLLIEIGERPDMGVWEGLIGGGAIGLGQWLVLRGRISHAWWWIVASIVGWGLIGASDLGALGWAAPRTMQIPLRLIFGFADGLQIGCWLGALQWLVLSRQVPFAWLWTLVSTGSWAIGMAIGWGVGGMLRQATNFFLGDVVGLAVAWLVVGGLTGIALARLMQ
ncbi:MAG: hypothetical protein AB4352_03520 [Hormoscilla sp.]